MILVPQKIISVSIYSWLYACLRYPILDSFNKCIIFTSSYITSHNNLLPISNIRLSGFHRFSFAFIITGSRFGDGISWDRIFDMQDNRVEIDTKTLGSPNKIFHWIFTGLCCCLFPGVCRNAIKKFSSHWFWLEQLFLFIK